MNRIAMYHLETLFWIARLGTFGAAAERLNTTQPSVSARIRELEDQVGVALFRREGRRMMLTVRGRQLIQESEPLWNALESTLLSLKSFHQAAGIVRIGCGEIAAASCLPLFVAQLKKDMPGVTLEVEVDLTINLRQKLEKGLLDIAFLVGPVDDPALVAKSIGKTAMLWLVNKEVKSRISRRSGQSAFADLPIWSLSRPSHLYQVILESVGEYGMSPKAINTCNQVRTLIELVASGCGAGILPETMVRNQLKEKVLVPLSPDVKAAPIEFLVAITRAQDEPVVLEIFERAKKLRTG